MLCFHRKGTLEEAPGNPQAEVFEMTRSYDRRLLAAASIIALLILLLIPAILPAGEFKITRVIDGDSVKAEGCDIEIMVRLVGIDAPEASSRKNEPGQPFSQRSTKHLAGMVLNQNVDIKGYGVDRYNRVLGEIFLDGKNVNLEMVKMGFAEVYRGRHAPGFDPSSYNQAEKEAMVAKRGMWVQGDKYLSPREWRRIN
jgi:micrococcal nuclease